jgi:hypothetical protein
MWGGGHNLPPLVDIGLTDLVKPGWAIDHPTHLSPTSLFLVLNKLEAVLDWMHAIRVVTENLVLIFFSFIFLGF